MTRPAAPVGWTPSLPRCCPREEFWSFSCSHCNICAEFFSHIQSATFEYHGGYLALEKCNQKIDKSKLYSWCWPIVTWEGKLGVICLGLAATPTDQGAADKVELYFYLHFISLYLYLYLYLYLLSTPFDWWEGGLICFRPRTPKIPKCTFCLELM